MLGGGGGVAGCGGGGGGLGRGLCVGQSMRAGVGFRAGAGPRGEGEASRAVRVRAGRAQGPWVGGPRWEGLGGRASCAASISFSFITPISPLDLPYISACAALISAEPRGEEASPPMPTILRSSCSVRSTAPSTVSGLAVAVEALESCSRLEAGCAQWIGSTDKGVCGVRGCGGGCPFFLP